MSQLSLMPDLSMLSSQRRSTVLRALVPAYLYALVSGIGTVMLGPLLPSLMEHWKIQDAQAGTLFAASFAGQLCGACFGSKNLRRSILYGAALSAIAVISLSQLGFSMAHLALFCMGLGLGAGLTASNIIAGTTVPESRTRLLAILGVAWGTGAIASPLLVRICSAGGPQRFFHVAALCFAASTLVATIIPRSINQNISLPDDTRTAKRLPLPPAPLFAFASAILLYVGIENSLGGWLPSYAGRVGVTLPAATISLCFWVAMLGGRLLFSVLLHRMRDSTLYKTCLVLLIVIEIFVSTIVHPSNSWIITLVVLAGLALAPLFPLILSFLLARTGKHARLGPLFASASLGGAVLPWLTGVLSTEHHSLRTGLLVPAIGAVCLLGLSSIVTGAPRTH